MASRKRAAVSDTSGLPPAKHQAPLESFGFKDLGKMQLRGRAVTKKTAKGTKGQLKRSDFEVTPKGTLEIKVPIKEKDTRARSRVGVAHLKQSAKDYHMKTAKMNSLLHDFPALEIVNSERGKYLRCSVCYDFVLDSKVKASPSHIKEHLNTPKHQRLMSQKAKQLSGVISIKNVFKVDTMTPDDETNIFRARCVEAVVGAGIPLQKVDLLRDFLQFYCHHPLSDSANLRKFVPTLRSIQRDEIKAAIRLYPIFLVHDGTNRFSEFYAIVVRWVDDTFNLQERLVEMEAFTGKHNAAGLVHLLNRLLVDLGVDAGDSLSDPPKPSQLLGCQRDREATNAAASEGLVKMHHCAFNLECCSHALNKVGENLRTPNLVVFKDQLAIACNSSAFRDHCRQYVPRAFRKPSSIRWWSVWELYSSLLEHARENGPLIFDLYLEAFRAARDASGRIVVEGATEDSVRIGRLADFANDNAAVDAVRLELVAIVAIGRPFVQATYALEGAGCCSLEAYKWLQDLRHWLAPDRINDLSYPGLRQQIQASAQARLSQFASNDLALAAVEQEIRDMIRPALEFCRRVFDDVMAPDFELYKFISSMNPLYFELYFQQNTVDHWLTALKKWFGERFTQMELDGMHAELPTLRQHVEGFLAERRNHQLDESSDERNKNIWFFWRKLLRIGDCPLLRKLVQLALTIVPSSAACERCFSLLKSMFTTQQLVGNDRGALEDGIGLSVASRFRENNIANTFHNIPAIQVELNAQNPIVVE
jgi:hypothetical protein